MHFSRQIDLSPHVFRDKRICTIYLFSYGTVMKTMNLLVISLFLMALLSASSCMAPVSGNGKQDKDSSRTEEVGKLKTLDREKLLAKARDVGFVKVIVHLEVPDIEQLTKAVLAYKTGIDYTHEELKKADDADDALASGIYIIASNVISRLDGFQHKVNYISTSTPFIYLDVSAEALEILVASPDVGGVEEDIPVPPLIQSPTTY